MTDTTNALRELIEAAEGHLREYASGQRHNDEGRRYKATQRLRAAIAALATAQTEAKPEGVDDATDAALWRKHKDSFAVLQAMLEAASPLVLNKLKAQEAAHQTQDIKR